MSDTAVMLLISAVLAPIAGALALYLRAKARQIDVFAELAAKNPDAIKEAEAKGVDVEPLKRHTQRFSGFTESES